ncbi:copper homeostasis protein CutC [Microbacterium sp. zg.Y1090]|uniref:copper homeostasis protein CutC n=1 Tax=Microbacterium TaxID=33882 RepID=UPI00214C523B|nr:MULTISPECIES: copper homeostasis protein CutC [unclassified Microbacterium]MCR2811575.1 copper homeostasis protein CutC [Microbacterium sp. zg.Y1084]MCR2819003.1 copper homeostasis protein CutC [Microbacterium sp. zg.Y1090]MDL5487653.1 copper homeostasis protein CutC [Microbacterium sp. zg-Y1211]WIM27308.1 copper homeostasis protein CutC [Microbacterium sp. zg-Y1090]
MSVIVEIAVQSAAGARIAMSAGADRLELCEALEVGGLTPSIGLVDAVCEAVGADRVNVLVRPRGGGFVYDDDEVALVAADVRAVVARGVGGVVVGALDPDGRVDREALRRWRDAAGDATLVFHRAIDASPRGDEVLDALREEGVERVLTSGGAVRSIDGAARLADYVRRVGGAMEITAGGGVRPEDIAVLAASGVGAVHLSARARAGLDAPAGPGGGAGGHDVTDASIVAAAVAAARPGVR